MTIATVTEFPERRPDVRDRHELLHRRTCRVFGDCAGAEPPTLPALASAFAEYLVAWRDASRDRDDGHDTLASPRRLAERVARLDAFLRRAERALDPTPAVPEHPSGWLEHEAAGILIAVRTFLRGLDRDRPADERVRVAVMAAWGRYDDALSQLRMHGHSGSDSTADLEDLAELRDALLQQMNSPRFLLSRSSGLTTAAA
jgi:hypothetical protein